MVDNYYYYIGKLIPPHRWNKLNDEDTTK